MYPSLKLCFFGVQILQAQIESCASESRIILLNSLDSLVEGSQFYTKNLSNFSGQHWALLEMWFANFGLKSEQLPRTPRTSLTEVFSFFGRKMLRLGLEKWQVAV